MSHLITDEQAQAAFDWLTENADVAASCRARRERSEYALKAVEADLFLQAEGTVAERQAEAKAHPRYKDAYEALCRVIENDESFRNNRNKCEAIISAWQTCKATERAFSRVA